ncbi:hypothetical protein CRG98_022393 [Punica granatum]|uniref:Pentatricopeptide repeat-containing protein n=1 Tax=Punica granatum TaxID=22663 RepID=A0A2I0JLQ8_PUNGR|nr:hypothetical protein CRG98_022393 [Punica granatum]
MVDFGFAVMGRMLKLGFKPDVVPLTTLVNGLCIEGKLFRAVQLVDVMEDRGSEPDVVTYGAIVKGLVRTGKTDVALSLLQKWEGRSCTVDVVTCIDEDRGHDNEADAHELGSRTSEEGAEAQDLGGLHVPSGPITRAKVKQIQQAMGSLLMGFLGQEESNSIGSPKAFIELTCHEMLKMK